MWPSFDAQYAVGPRFEERTRRRSDGVSRVILQITSGFVLWLRPEVYSRDRQRKRDEKLKQKFLTEKSFEPIDGCCAGATYSAGSSYSRVHF